MGQDPFASLKRGLKQPAAYPHPIDGVQFIETHISLIVLAGEYAYKLKKPVDLGFVDYSTLERRRHFCEEEVRLNRRFGDTLYLGVVALCGSTAQPTINTDDNSDDPPFEYAVQMRRFAAGQQWDRRLADGRLQPADMDALADLMADFHAHATRIAPGQGLGGASEIGTTLRNNFVQTRSMVPELIPQAPFDRLSDWTEAALASHQERLNQRLADGFVREGHGDAHLANITTIDGQVTPFDCIEFNPTLRSIDVLCDMAFPQMDLDAHGRADLGWHLLNRYLEQTGDYAGLPLLPLYLSYRAYVRAKVAALSPDAHSNRERIHALVTLAESYTRPPPPTLLVMVGVTGSGKSTVAAMLADQMGAIRVRSDIERKRLANLPRDRRPTGVGDGPYSDRWTHATYNRLHGIAQIALSAGFNVVLDATYLDRNWRDHARQVAHGAGAGYLQVHCQADPEELTRRIQQRATTPGDDPSDGTEEVLQRHLQIPPPGEDEQGWTLAVATDRQSPEQILSVVQHQLQQDSP